MLVVKSNKPKWSYPSMMEQFFDREVASLFGREAQAVQPDVNIAENEQGYSIELAVPGLKKDDFKITLDKERLTVSADVQTSAEEKNPGYIRKEFSYQQFTRSFNLPKNVNKDAITASYDNGVLTVSVPKAEKTNEPAVKTISIA